MSFICQIENTAVFLVLLFISFSLSILSRFLIQRLQHCQFDLYLLQNWCWLADLINICLLLPLELLVISTFLAMQASSSKSISVGVDMSFSSSLELSRWFPGFFLWRGMVGWTPCPGLDEGGRRVGDKHGGGTVLSLTFISLPPSWPFFFPIVADLRTFCPSCRGLGL